MRNKGKGESGEGSIQGSAGGEARAQRLTPEERKAQASLAATKRWAKMREAPQGTPKATHSGTLEIGDKSFACAVLSDGRRVLSETKFMEGMGIYRSGALSTRRAASEHGAHLPLHMAFKNLIPFIDSDLSEVLNNPVIYITEKGSNVGHGIPADVIPKICEVWLKARDAGVLGSTQFKIAATAEALVRALAQVGIVAMIDEATGFQVERERGELQKLLALYLSEEKLKWAKMFPDEFYKQLFRLRGWSYVPNSTARPGYVGKLTDMLVYEKLPPGIIDKLREKNPIDPTLKRRKHRHFQFLSEDIGQPDLRDHLLQLIAIMRVSKDWEMFKTLFDLGFPANRITVETSNQLDERLDEDLLPSTPSPSGQPPLFQ